MPIELPKSQKKIARELIQKSLQIECTRFIEEMEQLIAKQKRDGKSSHEIYLDLYEKTQLFDKHIERRYDNMRGSIYLITILGIMSDKILTEEDINRFDDDIREYLLNTLKRWDNF